MPSGRRLPLAFGIYTRRTGTGSQVEIVWCAQLAISALAIDDSASRPSIPAVLRPALRCVTCRTLTSVFDQDRSISFCRDRTLAQSPSRVALKILRRSRPTLPSWVRHWMASQSGTSSGPFTVTVSNLSFGSEGLSASAFKGSPAHVSTPWGPATRAGIRPVIPDDRRRTDHAVLGFLPPFGHRHWLLGHPVPAGDFRSPHGRPTRHRLDPDGVSTFHTPEIRPDWAPSSPRDPAVLSRPVRSLRPPLAASSSGQALSPRSTSHPPELSVTGHHQGFTRVRPPGLPPHPVDPLDGTGALGLLPRASHPNRQNLRRTPGRGTGIEHSPEATRPTSSALHSASSLAVCDLVSQGRRRHGPLCLPCPPGVVGQVLPPGPRVGRQAQAQGPRQGQPMAGRNVGQHRRDRRHRQLGAGHCLPPAGRP